MPARCVADDDSEWTATEKTVSDAGAAELAFSHTPVELRFQLGQSHSCSVLCATGDYRIEGHEKKHAAEESANQATTEQSEESDVSRASSERLRHLAVFGRLIPLETGDRMLLTFELTWESGGGRAEESRSEEHEHDKEAVQQEATQQEESETSFHAQGSTMVECGKTYTLARFGEKTVTVSVGELEGVAKRAALHKGDIVVVTFDHVAIAANSDESPPSTSRPPVIRPFAASVVDIRPNGMLILEGHRMVRTGGTIYEEHLIGEICPEHVRPDRQISSSQIAGLQIEKRESKLPSPKDQSRWPITERMLGMTTPYYLAWGWLF